MDQFPGYKSEREVKSMDAMAKRSEWTEAYLHSDSLDRYGA